MLSDRVSRVAAEIIAGLADGSLTPDPPLMEHDGEQAPLILVTDKQAGEQFLTPDVPPPYPIETVPDALHTAMRTDRE
jgi:hypothetical protein